MLFDNNDYNARAQTQNNMQAEGSKQPMNSLKNMITKINNDNN